MTMRALLRKLIGWDELDARFVSAESAKETETALSDQIELLRNKLALRVTTTVHRPYVPPTWEDIQVAFSDNTEHFKEQS